MQAILDRLIFIRTSNPDDARRRLLLNIILLSLEVLIFVTMLVIIGAYLSGAIPFERLGIIVLALFAMICFALIYLIGRKISSMLSSIIFLTVFTALFLFGDSAKEVVSGHSVIFLVLPIIVASMLIRPSASFLLAFIIMGAHVILATRIGEFPNPLYHSVFLVTALFSWLSAHTLEAAISALRATNRDLDKRVSDRTQELSETLVRERTEAGRNRAILESIADGVLVFDSRGALISANPAISRMVRRDIQQSLGQTFLAMLSKSKLDKTTKEAMQKAYQSPENSDPVSIQIGKKALSLILSPVLLEEGEARGTVAVLHDITHEVEISNIKSTFVSMVSHELRTPLSAAMGLIELLQIEINDKLDESQAYLFERVMANNNKLVRLLNDLIDLAKIEAGTLTIQPTRFSPAELLRTLSEIKTSSVSAKGLQLVTTLQPEVPEVLVSDPERLNQILVNLVTNALKFTSEGQISVRFFLADPEHFGLEISDTGQGIPDDALEHIFDPFWQADSSISRRHGGAGLGLSIVKNLVQLMNGSIEVHSIEKQGSTFTITLPLQTEESKGQAQ